MWFNRMNTVVGITDNWSDEGKYVGGCFANGAGRGGAGRGGVGW